MHKKTTLVVISFLFLFFLACSGKVKTQGGEKSIIDRHYKFNAITITLDPEVKKKLKKNRSFSVRKMQSASYEVFIARKLLADTSPYSVNFHITDLRARTTAGAIVLGPLGGKDLLVGEVTVKDPSGKVLESFLVKTSYSLGGVATGLKQVRMTWLYKKFAILAANTFQGTPDYHTSRSFPKSFEGIAGQDPAVQRFGYSL